MQPMPTSIRTGGTHPSDDEHRVVTIVLVSSHIVG
jgi:hypothetical protein